MPHVTLLGHSIDMLVSETSSYPNHHIIDSPRTERTSLSLLERSSTKTSPDKWDVTYLPVGKDGLIDLQQLREAIREDTALVSVMFVNNEIGVMQDMKEIGVICKERNVLFHTDAAQAIGKVPVDVQELGIHLMSISGHKVGGEAG